MVAQDLEKWTLSPSFVLCCYTDDIMLTCDDLLSLSQDAVSLQERLKARGWEVNTDKKQRLGESVKFLGALWSGETTVMPETVIDKIQAYPHPAM